MSAKVYWVLDRGTGRLGIMPRPRGEDWLEDEILSLRQQEVFTLVSLLEKTEINELGLGQEAELCDKTGIEYVNFPIKDRGIPTDTKAALKLVNEITNTLKKGRLVVIHCRMGIGRSSIMAVAVMVTLGFSVNTVFEQISTIRGLAMPDTKEQVDWLFELLG